jgi:hypothetical protein
MQARDGRIKRAAFIQGQAKLWRAIGPKPSAMRLKQDLLLRKSQRQEDLNSLAGPWTSTSTGRRIGACPGTSLGIIHWRLSGHQKMAIVSRRHFNKTSADKRGGTPSHRHGAPSCRHCADDRRIGRELRRRARSHIFLAKSHVSRSLTIVHGQAAWRWRRA